MQSDSTPAATISRGRRGEAALSPARRGVFWALLLACALAVTLAFAELALRLLFSAEGASGNYWGPGAFVGSETLGYRHAPGFRGHMVRRGVFRVPVVLSEQGFRESDLARQLRLPRRLLILGDSFAFGLGVREEHTFAKLIQPALNSQGLGVINAAQTGYGVEQEVRLGLELVERYVPQQIALFLFLANDVEGDFIADFKQTEVRHGYRLLKERWLPVAPVDFLRTRTYLGLYLRQQLERRRFQRLHRAFVALAQHEPRKVLQPTLEALRRLKARCDERGIRLGVVLVPPRRLGRPFYRPVKRALRAEGIAFLDLERLDFTEDDYFVGDGHWDEDGHRKVAQHLTSFLLGEGAVASATDRRVGAGTPAPPAPATGLDAAHLRQ